MATIKVSCVICGDVTLPPKRVRLVVCNVEARSYYTFDCPRCGDEVRGPADKPLLRYALAGAGVRIEAWDIPAEALEAHDGPAIGWDDVLDFGLAMGQPSFSVTTDSASGDSTSTANRSPTT